MGRGLPVTVFRQFYSSRHKKILNPNRMCRQCNSLLKVLHFKAYISRFDILRQGTIYYFKTNPVILCIFCRQMVVKVVKYLLILNPWLVLKYSLFETRTLGKHPAINYFETCFRHSKVLLIFVHHIVHRKRQILRINFLHFTDIACNGSLV